MDVLTDVSLLFLRVMVGVVFADSGYNDLKDPDGRSKGLGVSRDFAIFLGVAEVLGGIAITIGFLQRLAALGLILIMLGAVQKKIFVWKTGFWGKTEPGWYYDLVFVSALFVIFATDGGGLVMLR